METKADIVDLFLAILESCSKPGKKDPNTPPIDAA